MTTLQERQRGGGGGGSAGGGGTGGGGGRGSSGGGVTGAGGAGRGGGSTGGGGASGGGTSGSGAGSGGTGGGGGRGSSGSGGAKPGAGAGAGAGIGGKGGSPGPQTPHSESPTRPRTIGPPSGINFGGKPRIVSAYGSGGGPNTVIRVGEPFAGRSEGGGTRNQIFGTKTYGSGYREGLNSRGVVGRPFPFYFWPIVWGGTVVGGGVAYLDATDEYGDVDNSTRPGGSLLSAMFRSPSSNSTFHVMSDNDTVTSLVFDLPNNCSSKFSTNPAPISTPLGVNGKELRPEQAIQYYRASSIVLTLDGYNNTATFGTEETPETPLPSGVDMILLTCLNQTIGKAAPLVDAPPGPVPTTIVSNAGTIPQTYSSFDLVCLLFILWTLIKSLK